MLGWEINKEGMLVEAAKKATKTLIHTTTATATATKTVFRTIEPHPGPTITVGPPAPSHHPRFNFDIDFGSRASCIAIWVIFGVFTAGLIGVGALAMKVQRERRVFHAISALALAITMTAYLMTATNFHPFFVAGHGPGWHFRHGHHGGHDGHGGHGHHGKHPHTWSWFAPEIPPTPPPHHEHPHPTLYMRQTFWARDASHALVAPLLIAQLALTAGMAPVTGILAAISGSAACLAFAVAGQFVPHVRKHIRMGSVPWIAVGYLWALLLFVILFIPGMRAARVTGSSKRRGAFSLLTLLTFVTWFTAHVFFWLGPATGLVSVTTEVIVIGVMDVAAQMGFVFFLLLSRINMVDADGTWEFPSWFVNVPDGRGSYAPLATDDNARDSSA